jgi:hypothetical protein
MKKNIHKLITLIILLTILIIKIYSIDNPERIIHDDKKYKIIDIILKNEYNLNNLNEELKNYIINDEYYLYNFWNNNVKYVNLPIPNNIIDNQKYITNYIKYEHDKEFFRCFFYASYLNFNSVSIYIKNMGDTEYENTFSLKGNKSFFKEIKNTEFYKKIVT